MTPTIDLQPTQRLLRLDMDWRWHRPKRRPSLPKGEPRLDERPVHCLADGIVIGAPAAHLPYDDGAFDLVECGAVFAYIRNDEGLANELARITAPTGTINLKVPATGLLAGLDAFNLHRYLVDTSGRGLRPFETAEIGWRRHYSLADLTKMLDPARFELKEARTSSVAAAEVVRLIGFGLFRWLRPSRNRYRQVSRIASRLLAYEDRIEWRHGFWLTATFERKINEDQTHSGPVPI